MYLYATPLHFTGPPPILPLQLTKRFPSAGVT